jgi:hypothetical protein
VIDWKGREVSSPGDYIWALTGVETAEEAQHFRELMMESGAMDRKVTDRNIGWLTGEMAADDAERVKRLFDVKHPIGGDLTDLNYRELLELGMQFMAAQLNGLDYDASANAAQRAVRLLRAVRVATTRNGDG